MPKPRKQFLTEGYCAIFAVLWQVCSRALVTCLKPLKTESGMAAGRPAISDSFLSEFTPPSSSPWQCQTQAASESEGRLSAVVDDFSPAPRAADAPDFDDARTDLNPSTFSGESRSALTALIRFQFTGVGTTSTSIPSILSGIASNGKGLRRIWRTRTRAR